MKKELWQIAALFCIELMILLPIYFVTAQTPGPTVGSSTGVVDSEPPFIDVEIPSYYNKEKIDIEGTTEAYSTIRVYVDGNLRRQFITDAAGSFTFYNIALGSHGTKHVIRIWASDIVENIAEKEYSVIIDTVKPTLTVNIPAFTAKGDLTINGSVDEQAIVKFFVEYGVKDIIAPAQVTGLINESIRENSIRFSWDEDSETDFDMYIIYREDIGAIATTSSKSYTTYTDVLVDSGETYTYQISAIDKSGNEGLKSNALTITTLQGGRVGINPPKKIDISAVAEPEAELEASGSFSQVIRLDKDGSYRIKIEASDRANNIVAIEGETLLDTKPLRIVNITPRSGSFIYENYADEIRIEGDVRQGVIVNLYINKSGVGREDYTTATDENGHFVFEDVDVTPYFTGSITPREVSPEELGETWRSEYGEIVRRANLNFVAIDKYGRSAEETIHYRIGTCWSGDFSWNIRPLLEYQSPTFLSTERLVEGTEAIYFLVNLSYVGLGTRPSVESISFQKACDDYIIKDPRYNYSCRIMPSSCNLKCNQAKTTCYVTCQLSALGEMDKWFKDDWEGFFKAIGNEFVFPFRTRTNYNYRYEGKQRREYQTTCFSVSYAVDNSKINFKDALPDWLLYDVVDWLNGSITTINDWLDNLRNVIEIVGTGCIISFVTKFALQVYRRITCDYDNIQRFLEKVIPKGGIWEEEDECEICLIEHDKILEKDGKLEDIKQNQMSDYCLEKCHPRCSGAWKAEEKNYQIFRWTCDRFFGHSTPSKWTDSVSDEDLYQKAQLGNVCKKDEAVRGQPIRAVKCKDIAPRYEPLIPLRDYYIDQKCYQVQIDIQRPTEYYVFSNPRHVGDDVYEFNYWEKRRPEPEYTPVKDGYSVYAVKQAEDRYLTTQNRYCDEVCGIKGTTVKKRASERQYKDGKFQLPEGKEKEPQTSWACITTKDCLDLNQKEKDKGRKIQVGDNVIEVERAIPRGYTRDCFYKSNEPAAVLVSANVVSDDPDKRMECCCINTEGVGKYAYYKPEDIEKRDSETGEKAELGKYEDMRWSYRYWKINWEALDEKGQPTGRNKYNPDRYIKERDQPACFGQNNWLYDGFGKGPTGEGETGNLLIIDPAKQFDAAFQCLAMTQIYNRLMLIKNIMTALRNCLITVRTTGTADTGVCKELFSQYICSLIWKIISYMQDGCLPFGEGISWDKSESNVAEAVSVGMSGLWESVADSQQELMSEYGNAELQNLLGVGEEAVARKLCLAAFGYDWDLDLENVIDVAYATTYASLVQAVTRTREYLTFDPSSLQGTYEYRASWLINPGCDIENYNVYLACVTAEQAAKYPGIDCTYQGDPMGSNCDCLYKEDGREEIRYFYDGRGLKQNVLEDRDKHAIITAPYRYDHLKFELRPSRAVKEGECFPDGHEDGIFYFPIKDRTARDIVACQVDPTTGYFSCESGAIFWGEEGVAYFVGVELDTDDDYDDEFEGKTYYIGDIISAKIKVYKDPQAHCWMAELRDANGNALSGDKGKRVYGTMIEGMGTYVYDTGLLWKVTEVDLSKTTAENVRIVSVSGTGTLSGTFELGDVGQSTTRTIEFIDDGDEVITLSTSSADKYKVDDAPKDEKYFTDCTEESTCYINIKNLGRLKVTNVEPTGTKGNKKQFRYKIEVSGVKEEKVDEIKWILHLDLRNLKSQTGSCDEVIGKEYDDTAVIYKAGQRQEYDIPIYITSKLKVGGRCLGDGSKNQTTECVCDIEQGRVDCGGAREWRFCYKVTGEDHKTCRMRPQCKQDGTGMNPSLYPCDCDSNGEAKNFTGDKPRDCSGDKYLYCYDSNEDGIAECHKKRMPETVAPTEDKTPPTIKLLNIGGKAITDPNKEHEIKITNIDSALIKSKVIDDNQGNVEVYFVNYEKETDKIEMKDDGTYPDEKEGDNIYTTKWPSDMNEVDYEYAVYIMATDGINTKPTQIQRVSITS